MRFSPPVVLMLLSGAAVLWALEEETSVGPRTSASEAVYEAEQHKIDLVLAEFALEASSGDVSPQVIQERVDYWTHANVARLTEQAERAELLDRAAPLPQELPVTVSVAHESEADSSPEAVRISEINALQRARTDELAGDAGTPEELQRRIDVWSHSPEGVALFAERTALDQRLAAAWPLGSKPVVLEVPDDASPAEVATLDVQERMARRIQAIRQQNPKADPKEMQRLIDLQKDEVDEDIAQLGSLLQEIRHANLVKEVERLRGMVDSPSIAVPPR